MICARQSVVRVECVLVGYRLGDHIEMSTQPSKLGGVKIKGHLQSS